MARKDQQKEPQHRVRVNTGQKSREDGEANAQRSCRSLCAKNPAKRVGLWRWAVIGHSVPPEIESSRQLARKAR